MPTLDNTLPTPRNDYTFDFTVTASGTVPEVEENVTASSLPNTGFAPQKITTLPPQPATLDYAQLGDIVLEIPSLNVKSLASNDRSP